MLPTEQVGSIPRPAAGLLESELFGHERGAIELPPLRERPEDIRLLVHHLAMDCAARLRKPIRAISEGFITALVPHSLPGNVRQLQNFIERSVILTTGSVLNGLLLKVI